MPERVHTPLIGSVAPRVVEKKDDTPTKEERKDTIKSMKERKAERKEKKEATTT